MRIDRSKISFAVPIRVGALRGWQVSFGTLRVVVVPETKAEADTLAGLRHGRDFQLVGPDEAFDLIEGRILAGRSAHEKIAMLRSGLPVSEQSSDAH